MTNAVAVASFVQSKKRSDVDHGRRIVFINRFFHPDISATSQLLSELAFSLSAKGKNVHVITSQRSYQSNKIDLPTEEVIDGVNVHRIWTTDFGRKRIIGRSIDYLTFYIFAFLAMLRWLRPGDTLVAKTDPPLISVVAVVASKLRGASQVNWLQDLFPEIAAASGFKSVRGPFKQLLQYVRDLSLHYSRCNVVIGQLMRKNLLARGIPDAQIRVIQNWAIGDVEPVEHRDNHIRTEWGLDGKFVVGYSGNLGMAHDYDIVLNGAEQLRDRDDIRFLFIGSGKHTRKLQQEVALRKLPNFIFKPYQPADQLKYSLSAIDLHIVILKEEFEGLIVPSKFFGVAAVARPVLVVGSTDGEVPRLMRACTDMQLAVDTSEDFVDCVLEFSEGRADAAVLGQAMLKRYGSRARFSNVVESWRAILAPADSLLSEQASSPVSSGESN